MSIRVLLPPAAVAILSTLALSGCGSFEHSAPAPAVSVLSPQALSSLTNYRARLSSGAGRARVTVRTQVYSPSNWASESGLIVLHIGALSYVRLANRWVAHRQQPNAYAQSNLPAFAREFYAMSKVSGTRVRRGGPCRQAGLPGRTWTIRAPGGATFGERLSACVANGSGALLRLAIVPRDTEMAGRYASEVYEITAIGDVPPLRAPRSGR